MKMPQISETGKELKNESHDSIVNAKNGKVSSFSLSSGAITNFGEAGDSSNYIRYD